MALAAGVTVPESHRRRNLTPPGVDPTDASQLPWTIYSGSEVPDDASISVPYGGEWFWIENSDWRSKRMFVTIMFLFTLADTGASEKLPQITIPAQ